MIKISIKKWSKSGIKGILQSIILYGDLSHDSCKKIFSILNDILIEREVRSKIALQVTFVSSRKFQEALKYFFWLVVPNPFQIEQTMP
jgi:hypothetical protein